MKSASLLLCLVLAPALLAVDVAYAPPLGGITVTLAGSVAGVPKVSTFSLSMRMPLASSFTGKGRGALAGVTSTTMTDSNAGWVGGALSQAALPYFIRMRSGAADGTWWQISTSAANTGSIATVTNRGINPLTAGVGPGDAYEIVPADTLDTLFGSIAATIGSTNAETADLVRLHDGVNWREYYYNTTANQWREGASTFNRSNTIVRPDAGVVYVRKGTGNLSLRFMGAVSTRVERMTVGATGVTAVGSVFPVSRTLGGLGIHSASGFVPYTGSLASADKVTVFDGINWRSFHYDQSLGQWREGTSTFNRNNFALPFGAPVIIERASGSASPYLVTFDPPYTL